MTPETTARIERFEFRSVHSGVAFGTASDRYAGWLCQIYSPPRYDGRITTRKKKIGKSSFTESVLPVDSVVEYFDHFSLLEIDFTFYSLLRNLDSSPARSHFVLEKYVQHLRPSDRLYLKVPQAVCALKLWRSGRYSHNPDYLDPKLFVNRFYSPVNDLAGEHICGFIFEQEYLVKKDRPSPEESVAGWDRFFNEIPADTRYHLELRTPSLLSGEHFEMLESHGVGQVLSHWTWLPRLMDQYSKSENRFFNSGKRVLIRLVTPRRLRYEETYRRAFPFDTLVPGMLDPGMIEDTTDIMAAAIQKGVRADVIINNRAGGNAPRIAQEVAAAFLERQERGLPV
ncbi:FIG003003: hypothetical protein [Olavius algarvensis associated proteobacterium Delta 3]|nr:FIG003003: hypothetical protein [Olavius algarvensis associated proteobacterium Delta 3]